MDDKTENISSSHEELIKLAKTRFNLAVEAESQNRKDEIDDKKFMVGEQWPIDIKNARLQDSRPCLTINRIPQFVRQITNDQRQNRPSIKINPVDDEADVDTAKIIQGIVRHIEYNSHADAAYDTAFEQAVKAGIGYFRITTEYSDPMSFQQEIKIKLIKDRFSVYLDPFYQEPDGSDCQWGFVFENMSKDEYEAQYPDSKLNNMNDWESIGEITPDWIKKDSVRVAEYYYTELENTKIVRLTDGTVIEKDMMPENLPDGLRIVSERTAVIPKVKWCKINGLEVLEETDIPGRWIPIIPVIGEEEILDGQRILSGIIRHAKDPQRMYNYWASSETEMIALAPKAPFIGIEGQFEGYEDQWKTANTKNHAFLQYKAKSIGGVLAPPPQRTPFQPDVLAITQARSQSAEDLKATTGIYDASLGNRSNEQSGLAIQRRNIQSQTGNFHFIDNLSRSLRHAGRIIINWIPKVYDTASTVRIIGEDGSIDMVKINQLFKEAGEEKGYFLDHGSYDCTVDTGPSFQTKRQEAVAGMLDLIRSVPQLMSVGGDLMVGNMDWPMAKELSERIKKTLPPGMADDVKDQKPLPPQVQAQLQQMNQMIQTLTKELDENTEIIRTKRLELESKERISLMEQETQLKVEILKHDAKDAQMIFSTEIDQINSRLQNLNFNQPIGMGAGEQPAAPQSNGLQQQPPTGGIPPGQTPGPSPGGIQ
jgi:hypothetical protein